MTEDTGRLVRPTRRCSVGDDGWVVVEEHCRMWDSVRCERHGAGTVGVLG
ncbi:hypothetical protein RYH80_17195 [Halobaculum sp. MBLA0147]